MALAARALPAIPPTNASASAAYEGRTTRNVWRRRGKPGARGRRARSAAARALRMASPDHRCCSALFALPCTSLKAKRARRVTQREGEAGEAHEVVAVRILPLAE